MLSVGGGELVLLLLIGLPVLAGVVALMVLLVRWLSKGR